MVATIIMAISLALLLIDTFFIITAEGGTIGFAIVAWIVATVCLIILIVTAVREKDERQSTYDSYKTKARNNHSAARMIGIEKCQKYDCEREQARRELPSTVAAVVGAMNASVYQEREHDWAIIGGIGGVGAALEAQIDNISIREENQMRKDAMKKKTDSIINSAVEAMLKPNEIVDYDNKYNLNFKTNPELLAEGISVNEEKIKLFYDTTTGCHSVKIPWTAVDGKPCIDGHFVCELFNKERFAGECKVSLHENGTFFKKEGVFEAYFPRLEVSGPYTVRLRIDNIWGIHVNKESR
jgi:hypothetical protein